MVNNKLEYRTYHLVLRQLNGINKGVQAEHSAKRYIWKYKDDIETKSIFDSDCPNNETTIILDGGTHQDLLEIIKILELEGVKHSYFVEPDLNNCITAITFIADERVWAKDYFQDIDLFREKYGDDFITNVRWLEHIGGRKNETLINILKDKRLSQ